MITNLASTARKYARKGEEIWWYGQPVADQSVKALKPVLYLIMLIGWTFLAYAAYQVFEGIAAEPAATFTDKLQFIPSHLFFNKFSIIAGFSFLIFRYALPALLGEEDNTFYMITDKRVLAIDHGGRGKVTSYGAGDIQKPSVRKRGKSSGDLLFIEESVSIGALDGGVHRKKLEWTGFINVDDVANAKSALIKWIKEHSQDIQVVNERVGIRLTLPQTWTIDSLKVDPEYRDETLFSLLVGEMRKDGRSIVNAALHSNKWNTLVLTKRGPSEASGSKADIVHLTMIFESALSNRNISGNAVNRFYQQDGIELKGLLDNPEEFTRTLKNSLLICKFNDLIDTDKKGRVYKARVNGEADEISLNEFNSYAMNGSMNIMGTGYAFRQIYSFDRNLHLRATFFCPDFDKGKLFKKESNQLDSIMKSVMALRAETLPAE